MSDQPLKFFPFLYGTRERRLHPDWPNGFPWHLLTPHEAQAQTNHGQSLETLAARGGLGPEEMYAVFTNQRYNDLVHAWPTSRYIDSLVAAASADMVAQLTPSPDPDRESIETMARTAVEFWRHNKPTARDRHCALLQLAELRKLGWKAPHDPVTDTEVEEAYTAYERDPYHLDYEAMRDAIEAARKVKPE